MSKKDLNNLLYFEALSMRELYDYLKSWQDENHQGFFRLNIEPEGDKFCCIALLSPVLYLEEIEEKKQEVAKTKYEQAIDRFKRKALRIIVKEEQIGAYVEFVDDVIPSEKIREIQLKLKQCATAWEIKEVFNDEILE